jgi:hypothetical protein
MLKFKDDNDVCNMTTVPLWIFSQYELNTGVVIPSHHTIQVSKLTLLSKQSNNSALL